MISRPLIEIRPVGKEGLGTFADLWNQVWPALRVSEGELVRDYENLPTENRSTVWLAYESKKAIGFAECHRDLGSYHPQKWTISVGVLPEFRRNGIGASLLTQMVEFLSTQDPICYYVIVDESDVASLHFATKRGYSEVKRDFESRLDLTKLVPELLEEWATSPVQICQGSDLDSPEFRRELHRAFEQIRVDTPRTDPPTPMTFQRFNEVVLEDPEFSWQGTHVAIQDGDIVGFTGIYRSDVEGELFQWLTGVKRETRGLGIAKALKARAAKWAIANGYRVINTDNDTRNAPMLAINDQLGFVRQLGTITMVKRLDV